MLTTPKRCLRDRRWLVVGIGGAPEGGRRFNPRGASAAVGGGAQPRGRRRDASLTHERLWWPDGRTSAFSCPDVYCLVVQAWVRLMFDSPSVNVEAVSESGGHSDVQHLTEGVGPAARPSPAS